MTELFYGKPDPVWVINNRRRNVDPYYAPGVTAGSYVPPPHSRGTSLLRSGVMMAAVITTALPPLCYGCPSLLATRRIRTRAATRCSGRSWLRECHTRIVQSPEYVLVRRRFGFEACGESDAEVSRSSSLQLGFRQGGTLSKTVRSAGVGLLASLITLAANFHFPGPVFGSEFPLEVSLSGRLSEKSAWDASSKDSFSRATSHNKILTVAENVTLPDGCAEEVATNLVAKEETVQEVTNESVVQEAWQVVNESFLDARHDSWSADAWLKKKEEVFKSPIRSRMAAYGAIRTMLSSLNDPYTRFLTPDQFTQLSKYDVTGIGLNIGESATASGDSYLKVFGIILGSPAQLVGVRQGDELLEVAGNSVRGKTPFEAASLIQGPKGTKVSIKIRHGRCGTPQVFEVERQQDVRSPVYYRLERVQDSKQLSGYIHLKEFNALAKRDILIAMKRMQDAGAASFVLDLRDNPGGLVQAGIEVARLFLDEGETVIETVGRDAKNIKTVLASHFPITQAPLTILVNDHTASASEIVAAALHDNCRAVLVGNRTFGKGLIQAVYELSDGSGVVLTVGKYVTPGHQDIDGAGIEPDYKQLPSPSAGLEKLRECKMLKASGNSFRNPVFS